MADDQVDDKSLLELKENYENTDQGVEGIGVEVRV